MCRCPPGYDLLQWPQDTLIFPGVTVQLEDGSTRVVGKVDVRKFNTQCAEQCNRALEKIRVQSSYMSQANFMEYTRYFLAVYNMEIIAPQWEEDLLLLQNLSAP